MPQRRKTAADLGEAAAIGRRLREARELFRMSQAELGAAIGGRAQQVIDRYESGKSRIPLGVAVRICRELNIRLEWLAEGTAPMLVSEVLDKEALRWVTSYASTLRENLTAELEAATNDESIDPRIRKACEMARAALQGVPKDELTMRTFWGLPWELIRPLNVLLTDHAPVREPQRSRSERDLRSRPELGLRRPLEELAYRCGGMLPIGLPPENDERVIGPQEVFERMWPDWRERSTKKTGIAERNSKRRKNG